jgi:ubiquinone/menaquinone biosynthesis C-methylase UbiE
LEIGCGTGELALALAARGHDVVAVDPGAPEGAIFRRTTIEELDDSGPFDAVVASFSLHHVTDLGHVLDKVAALLATQGVVIVDEFGWDLLDEKTAARYDVDLRAWDVEHADLHRFEPLRDGLGERFAPLEVSREPYFARWRGSDEDEERRLIEAGEVVALGFRFVGVRR